MQYLGTNNLKNNRMILIRFQGKSFNITVIQVYVPTTDVEEAEVDQFYKGLEDLLELTPNIYIYIYMFYSSLGIRMQK